jgi:hypothetical protein
MINHICDVPGFDGNIWVPAFYAGEAEINVLERLYSGVVITSLSASRNRLNWICERDDMDIVFPRVHVRGMPKDLIRHRFMHPDWISVPACGIRNHHTLGFGSAKVHRLKSGQYALRPARLDHLLDLLAVALTALYWSPDSRKRSV